MGTNSNSESRVASTNGCTEVMAASKNENDSSAVRQGEKTEQLIPADNDEKANSSLTKTKIRSIKKTMKKVNGECGKVYFVKDDEENLKLYVDAPVPNRNHELSQRIELYKSAFTTKPGPTIQQEKDLAKAILQDFGRCSFFITPNSNGNNKISSIPTAEITMFLRRTLAAKGSHTTIKCDSENVDATLLKVGAKKKDSHPNNTLEQDCALAAAKALLSVASSGGNSSPSLVASDSFAVRHGSEANNPSVTSAHVAGADSLEAPGKRKWAIHASSSTAPSAGGYYTIDTGANDRDVDSGTGDKRARQERTRVSSAIATPGNKASDLLNKNADFHPDIEDHQRRMLLAQIQANSNILGTTGLHTTYDSRHLRGAGMLDYKTLVDAAASGGTDVMGNSQELVLSMKAIQRSLLQERALKIAAQHQQELLIEQQVAAQRQNLLLEQRVVASLLGTPDAPARHQELMMLLAVQQQQQRSALMQEQRLAALLAAQNNAAPMKKEQGISHVQKKGPSTKTYEPSDAVKAAAAAIAAVTANSTPSDSANPILTFRKQGLGTHSKFASRKQKECNDKDLVPSMTEQAASHEATKKSELSKDEDIEDDEDEISCVELDSESEEELEDEDEDEDNDGVEDEKAEKAYVDDDNKSTKIKEACTVVNSEHTENALQIGGIRYVRSD